MHRSRLRRSGFDYIDDIQLTSTSTSTRLNSHSPTPSNNNNQLIITGRKGKIRLTYPGEAAGAGLQGRLLIPRQ